MSCWPWSNPIRETVQKIQKLNGTHTVTETSFSPMRFWQFLSTTHCSPTSIKMCELKSVCPRELQLRELPVNSCYRGLDKNAHSVFTKCAPINLVIA